jgi:DNA polymerase-1
VKFDSDKTIFLIDGSSFLYRAYYSIKPLHTSTGEAVQAVFGFARMLKKLIDTFEPHYMALVWDSKGKTKRHEMFAEYKATRQAAPSDIFDQKEHIIELADLIGLHQVAQVGTEADDIMYSIAQERLKGGDAVVFVTSDKDMGQALEDNVYIFDTFKDVLFDMNSFAEKMGFSADRLPLYFALVGDASDNIPGVRGIGKKGATDLVQEFATLEELYDNIGSIKAGRTRTALQEQKKEAFLSRDLFLLQYHKTGISKKELSFDPKNWAQARSLFEKLNFKSLLSDLGVKTEETLEQKIDALSKYAFKLVATADELSALSNELKKAGTFAMDTEGLGLRPLQDRCIGISFCVEEGVAYYVPFGHRVTMFEQQLSEKEVVAALKPILEDPTYTKYLHNVKFDQLVLHELGIELAGATFDTMIAASLLSQGWQRAGLKFLSTHYFNEQMPTFQEMVAAHKARDFSYVPLDKAAIYSGFDAHQTFKLQKVLEKELKKEKKLHALFTDIEMPLVPVLAAMEEEGIYLDVAELKKLGVVVQKQLVEIEDAILEKIGDKYAGINLNSPKQIGQLLFEDLKLPPQTKSKQKGGYSTDRETLRLLADFHPVPALILQYRELAKLKNTYIDALPEYVNPNTGKIHTSYNQVAVATGRLASSDPNLQNIPTDGAIEGMQIRQAFKPSKGSLFFSADYSQIELRVLAHLSEDKHLIQSFLSDHDIHAETAARLFDVDLAAVTHDQRQIGKRINFSVLYGLTPYGLSKDLEIPFKEAKTYIDKYFKQYPGVSVWMESIIEFAKEHGYVETLWGRRRYVPGIYEDNQPLYQEARRIAINTVAQGTAAEVMKKGMIEVYKAIQERGIGAKIILQIHDELLLTIPESELEETKDLVQQILENVVQWKVPLKVTTRQGANWAEVTK